MVFTLLRRPSFFSLLPNSYFTIAFTHLKVAKYVMQVTPIAAAKPIATISPGFSFRYSFNCTLSAWFFVFFVLALSFFLVALLECKRGRFFCGHKRCPPDRLSPVARLSPKKRYIQAEQIDRQSLFAGYACFFFLPFFLSPFLSFFLSFVFSVCLPPFGGIHPPGIRPRGIRIPECGGLEVFTPRGWLPCLLLICAVGWRKLRVVEERRAVGCRFWGVEIKMYRSVQPVLWSFPPLFSFHFGLPLCVYLIVVVVLCCASYVIFPFFSLWFLRAISPPRFISPLSSL